MSLQQKEIFLNGEGDNWFKRNYRTYSDWSLTSDPIISEIPFPSLELTPRSKILEIGCGQGLRLKHLKDNFKCNVVGLDPSSDSTSFAKGLGLDAVIGTADSLPFEDNSFDLVIFGFCLYLCDKDDLPKIVSETHRVLKSNSWLIIYDFWSDNDYANEYKHRAGVISYKSDYSKMFTWHPSYKVFMHKIFHHSTHTMTDACDEHSCVTLIRVLC